MTMADKIAVMNNGRIEQMGAPEELYESPRTAFVANFLGSSNLLEGEVRGTEGDTVVADVVGQQVRVPKDRVHSTHQNVFVGVRPEKIHVVEHGTAPSTSENEISGIVLDSSFIGIGTEYVVTVTGSVEPMKAFVQNHSAGARLAPGTPVSLRWQIPFTFALDGHEDPHAGEGSAVGPATGHISIDADEMSASAKHGPRK